MPRAADRLAEIKHWYALHLLPQRRLMEDIHWMVNRIEELEDSNKILDDALEMCCQANKELIERAGIS